MALAVMPLALKVAGAAGGLGRVRAVISAVSDSPLLLIATTSKVYSVSAVKPVNS